MEHQWYNDQVSVFGGRSNILANQRGSSSGAQNRRSSVADRVRALEGNGAPKPAPNASTPAPIARRSSSAQNIRDPLHQSNLPQIPGYSHTINNSIIQFNNSIIQLD